MTYLGELHSQHCARRSRIWAAGADYRRQEAVVEAKVAAARQELQSIRDQIAIEQDHLAKLKSQIIRLSQGLPDIPPVDTAVAVDAILRAVAKAHGIPLADIKGKRRGVCIVRARHHACYLFREIRPDMSFPWIGRVLGGRDHSTIMHGAKRWGELKAKYLAVSDAVDAALLPVKEVPFR